MPRTLAVQTARAIAAPDCRPKRYYHYRGSKRGTHDTTTIVCEDGRRVHVRLEKRDGMWAVVEVLVCRE